MKNALTLAIGGVGAAEIEPLKVWGYGVSTPDPGGYGVSTPYPGGYGVDTIQPMQPRTSHSKFVWGDGFSRWFF